MKHKKNTLTPFLSVEARIEMMERKQRRMSWCVSALTITVGIGFWICGMKFSGIVDVLSGIIGNITGILESVDHILNLISV